MSTISVSLQITLVIVLISFIIAIYQVELTRRVKPIKVSVKRWLSEDGEEVPSEEADIAELDDGYKVPISDFVSQNETSIYIHKRKKYIVMYREDYKCYPDYDTVAKLKLTRHSMRFLIISLIGMMILAMQMYERSSAKNSMLWNEYVERHETLEDNIETAYINSDMSSFYAYSSVKIISEMHESVENSAVILMIYDMADRYVNNGETEIGLYQTNNYAYNVLLKKMQHVITECSDILIAVKNGEITSEKGKQKLDELNRFVKPTITIINLNSFISFVIVYVGFVVSIVYLIRYIAYKVALHKYMKHTFR